MRIISFPHPVRAAHVAALSLLSLLAAACIDFHDTTPAATAEIVFERPAAFIHMTDLSGLTVTLQSATDHFQLTTDADGRAVATDLPPGTYHVAVAADLSAERYEAYTGQTVGGTLGFMLTASASQVVLTGDSRVSLPLQVYAKGSLVIGKLYASTSKLEKGTYSAGKYLEIYNNAADTVDAAGLYIGLLESESTIAYQQYPMDAAATPGTIYLKQLFRIPATDSVPVAPGTSLLLVNSATDHSTHNAYERDLRGADFEAKDATRSVPNNDDVPALELIYTCYPSISNMNLVQGGPTAVVLFRTDDDPLSWPTVYADGKTSGRLFLPMAASLVLDGIDVVKNKAQTGPDINSKRLPTDLDATYTSVTSAAGTAGERLVRRTAMVTDDGRRILQDTNNSLADFIASDTISPRTYLDPQ